jgi:hypothetical protein
MSTAEDVVDHRLENHLSEYYSGVLSLLCDADSNWIFGPGAANVELKHRLEREALDDVIITIETVDKMTNRHSRGLWSGKFNFEKSNIPNGCK